MSTVEAIEVEAASARWDAPGVLRYEGVGRHAKRAKDIVIALLGVIVFLPLMLVIAVIISFVSPGPALFGQRRVGQSGQVFRCWKFRTMFYDAEERLKSDPELYQRYVENDYKLEADEDPRVTRFGQFLRKTSLDELPQLFNVLIGNMSLVGPRPVVVRELDSYGPWKSAYLAAKPGVTGPWQCSGRNEIRYPERAMLDAEYLQQWSLLGDVKIMLKTVPAVLKRDGVA